MEKKKIIIFFLIFFIANLVFVEGENISLTTMNVSNTTSEIRNTSTITQNRTKVDLAFTCLENILKEDCSGASTVEQLAFSILATPKNSILKKCVEKLETKVRENACFGDSSCNIKDTALAILALSHVGKNTTAYENWLISQNKTSTEIEWILQQDSQEETNCKIEYDEGEYSFNAKENKKLSGNPGNCFLFTYNNYWLKLDETCYDKEFVVGCDKPFYLTWIYRTIDSSTINVMSNTIEGSQNTKVRTKIKSKCFGTSSNCNYEETAWAVLALKRKGYDIKDYIPYLVALEEKNKRYFPEVFSFMILEYSNVYGPQIMRMQKSEKYWEAENSAYGRYYDTALVLIGLGYLNQQQINDAKNWVWFSQERDGCWNGKNLRDSAILLWAIEKREATIENNPPIPLITRCREAPAGATCVSERECLEGGGSVLRNYDCSYIGLTLSCCNITPLKSCSELQGRICSEGEICEGTERDSKEGKCCLGECKRERVIKNECEEENKGKCKIRCGENEEEIEDYPCEGNKVCCKEKEKKSSSSFLIFVIIILLVLGVILYLLKDRIRVFIYKVKEKKKGEGGDLKMTGQVTPPQKPFGPQNNLMMRGIAPPNQPKPMMPPRPPMNIGPPQQQKNPPVQPPQKQQPSPSEKILSTNKNEEKKQP
ncbi:MAG: hypothetical protein QW273_00475 [Candidatus Pacearchaeota archaeon]